MESLEALTSFFGWCTVINMGLLVYTSLFLLFARGWVSRMHAKMFGLREEALSLVYFQYLAYFKIAVLVFNLVPYVALKIMA